MKYFLKFSAIALAITLVISSLLPATIVQASQGAVYFKPGSGKYTVGKSFTVQVWVDVQAQTPVYHTSKGAITFPNNLLQATKAVNSNSGADFSLAIKQSQGRVNFNTMLWGNLQSGFQAHVFDITFKVIKNGTARLGLASGTIMFDGPTTVRQASYSLAVPPCPSGQAGTWPNCYTPKPKPAPKPAPKPSPTPAPKPAPKPAPTSTKNEQKNSSSNIPPEDNSPLSDDQSETDDSDNGLSEYDGMSIGSVTSSANYETADVSWLTSQAATATFAYGTSKDALNIISEVKLNEQKSYSTKLANLKPGLTYYYQIDATGKDGHTSYSGQFQTKGYPVNLTITQGETPLAGATVLVGDDPTSYTTNDDGQVSLNISQGDHDITIKNDSGEATETISVQAMEIVEGSDPDTQNITVSTNLNPASSTGANNSGAIAIGVILFTLLILLAIGAVIFIKKRQAAATSTPDSQTFDDNFWNNIPGASGVTEDVYGNPVYTEPISTPPLFPATGAATPSFEPAATEPNSYGQGYPAETNTYQSPDQYYADIQASQNPSTYGYATATNTEPSPASSEYNYPPAAADTYATAASYPDQTTVTNPAYSADFNNEASASYPSVEPVSIYSEPSLAYEPATAPTEPAPYTDPAYLEQMAYAQQLNNSDQSAETTIYSRPKSTNPASQPPTY